MSKTYDAYVIVPVADLAGEPLTDAHAYTLGEEKYTNLFPRIHQLLYQEPVQVLKTKGDQVFIKIPNTFYITTSHTKPINSFWTLKKYLIPANVIKGDLSNLPAKEYFWDWNKKQVNTNIITLAHPYYDPACNLTFSAGTRFIQVPENMDKYNYTAFVIDPTTYHIISTKLPKALCMIQKEESRENKIKNFIYLIRSWITYAKDGLSIPYVWGGTSIRDYTRPSKHSQQNSIIKTGCDCAGLIFRAASICDIPYFFKNSYTATIYLKKLSKQAPLQEGDIVWVPGHVMIVANIKKNTLFEQRGYDHGYGKLQEISLKKVFKGLKTYTDLLAAYDATTPLYRMDITGSVRDRYPHFTILRLSSAWDIMYTPS